jgi:prepilin-type N-terminal cleavage/methylation domain-containing protein
MITSALRSFEPGKTRRSRGFTLIEVLVVVAVIAIMAGILLPTLSKSKSKAEAMFCLNNEKQITLAWIMYADEHNGNLAYNLGANGASVATSGNPPPPMKLNWVNNVLDWTTSNSDNTNAAKMVETGLGPYVDKTPTVYRCPSDHVLSGQQESAGWRNRVRSYSMNAMIGNAGSFSQAGWNLNNPDYVQFFRLTSIPQPADIFVILDEHPDSIDDGYFVERAYNDAWIDLPASYHAGAACFSFVDGHSETHRWLSSTTTPPSLPGAAGLPKAIPTNPRAATAELADFYWVVSRMSVEQTASGATPW